MNYLMTTNYDYNNQNIKSRPTKPQGVPFAWQDKRLMKIIRDNFPDRKRATAIALYQILTEMASNAGGKKGQAVSEFSVHHKTLAVRIQKSVSSIRRYLDDFRRLGVLAWVNKKWEKKNLANLYTLLDYSYHRIELASIQKNEPPVLAHSIERVSQERRKDSIIINKDVDKSESNSGFRPIKDNLDKRKI